MVHGNAFNSYKKAQVYDEMDPKKLIHMLYEGAIKRIGLAREGLIAKDPKKRGENLGKAIAIISELNACLDSNNKTQEIVFLKDFYTAMLIELPKVSVTEDVETLNRTEKYLTELKRIWETTVMNHPVLKQQKKSDVPDQYIDTGLKTYTSGAFNAYRGGSIAI
ncbi:MAG: flagellar export chaperone FliS [Pseudomonadota bacterium]